MTWLIDFVGYSMRNAPSVRTSVEVLHVLQVSPSRAEEPVGATPLDWDAAATESGGAACWGWGPGRGATWQHALARRQEADQGKAAGEAGPVRRSQAACLRPAAPSWRPKDNSLTAAAACTPRPTLCRAEPLP
jgi:hypothetical protein